MDNMLFTGNGVVMMAYIEWIHGGNMTCKAVMQRYCQYLQRFGQIVGVDVLEAMPEDEAVKWINDTYQQHCKANEIAVIEHVLNRRAQIMEDI